MRAKLSWKGKLANRRKHIAERSGGGKKGGKGKNRAGRKRQQEPAPAPALPSRSRSPSPIAAQPEASGVVYECDYDCGFASADFAVVERHEHTCVSAAAATATSRAPPWRRMQHTSASLVTQSPQPDRRTS